MEVSEYVNIIAVCRICLAQQGDVHLFGKAGELDGFSVAERIMSFACVEVNVNDGLPDKICSKCLTQINQAFTLKAQCEYADTTLRQLCTEDNLANNFVCFLAEGENCEDGEDELEHGVIASPPSNDKSMPEEPVIIGECANLDEILGSDNDESSQEGTLEISVSANKENKLRYAGTSTQRVYLNNDNYKEERTRVRQKVLKQMPERIKVTCAQCGEKFPNKKSLEAHGLSQPGHRPFLCDLCGKSFIRLSNLKEHEKKHSGVHAYLCSNCGELAPAKKNHYCMAIHNKSDKGFSCDICKKKFVSQSSLGTHKKRHESESKFKCEECGKLYFSRQELERHIRVHFNIRPFQCPEKSCVLTFFSQGELNRHTRYHRGLRRFSCKSCGQKFFESGHLATHERKHTGERPYNCRHCSKTFSDSSKLRRHALAHMKPTRKRRGEGVVEVVEVVGNESAETTAEGTEVHENLNVVEVEFQECDMKPEPCDMQGV